MPLCWKGPTLQTLVSQRMELKHKCQVEGGTRVIGWNQEWRVRHICWSLDARRVEPWDWASWTEWIQSFQSGKGRARTKVRVKPSEVVVLEIWNWPNRLRSWRPLANSWWMVCLESLAASKEAWTCWLQNSHIEWESWRSWRHRWASQWEDEHLQSLEDQ